MRSIVVLNSMLSCAQLQKTALEQSWHMTVSMIVYARTKSATLIVSLSRDHHLHQQTCATLHAHEFCQMYRYMEMCVLQQ